MPITTNDDGANRRDGDQSGTRRSPGRRRLAAGAAVLALVAGGASYVIATAGDEAGGPAPEGASGNRAAAAYEYAQCMRDEGIADFPDPTVEPDGSVLFENLGGLGVPKDRMSAAGEACRHLRAGGPPGGTGEQPGHVKEITPAAAGWERIEPGGDCQCADGSEYAFHTRKANQKKVVLFLDGGGACWSAETCAPDGSNEYETVADGPSGDGVFAFGNELNPFADHSFVYLPYCTGDVFLGDAIREYTPDLTIRHAGHANATAGLDHLATTFPDATEVVVIGSSAGSIAAPLYAGLVSDRLPEAAVTVFADSSGAYPDAPETDAVMDAWGTAGIMPDWPENAGLTTDQLSFPLLFVRAWRHDPDIVFARYDHAYDENQASHIALTGLPVDDLRASIEATEARIEDAGLTLHSYLAPGDDHVVFVYDGFYSETVSGVALVDWVSSVLAGEPVDDVRCTDCSTG